MRQKNLLNHRLTNLFHTVLLFAGMVLLLAILGWSLAGTTGLVWASVLGGLFVYLSARVPSQVILRMMGARPLGAREAPDLFHAVDELARRAGLPTVPRLYYIPGGTINALTVDGEPAPAIVVTDGLLRQLDGRELAGVLAHEISHLRQKDLQVLRVAGAINRITRMFTFVGQILLFLNIPLILMGQAPISWLTILVLLSAPLLSGLLQMALSRTREFEADLGAAWLTGDPEGMARALEKMSGYHGGLLRRLLWPGNNNRRTSLFSSHPAAEERVIRLRSLTDIMPRPPILLPEQGVYGPVSRPWRSLFPYRWLFRFRL